MPFYYTLRASSKEGKRTAQRLLDLQDLLQLGAGEDGERDHVAPVPGRTHRKTLLLATWNIREFDSTKYGYRRDEALFYIAELISHFDLVAVQEVRQDLKALRKVVDILGSHDWSFLVTDVTEGASGNSERMAFIFDTRKVKPTGLVGEIILPPKKGKAVRQFARSPFLVGFQAGWFKFSLCTAHIYYGGDQPSPKERVDEINSLASFLAQRAKKYRKIPGSSEYENVALLGDFNIFTTEDDTFKALTKNGFVVSEGCLGKVTNIGKESRTFDQIAFLEDKKSVKATGHAGVIDFYRVIYTPDDRDVYKQYMSNTIKASNKDKAESKQSMPYGDRTEAKQKTYYNAWKTFQMSDHLPLWVELEIDFSREYLERKAGKTKPSG